MHQASEWYQKVADTARKIIDSADGALVITTEEFKKRLRDHTDLASCPDHPFEHMGLGLKRRVGIMNTSWDPNDKTSQPRLMWLKEISESEARAICLKREAAKALHAPQELSDVVSSSA